MANYGYNEYKSKVSVAPSDVITAGNNGIFNELTVKNNMSVSGNITGSSTKSITGFGAVEGAIWNDLADSIEIQPGFEIQPGYCYSLTKKGCKKTSKYAEEGILVVASDTYGFRMGVKDPSVNCIDVALAGFVLAYVDKEYPSGTPLTCTEEGKLTEMNKNLLIENPAALVGFYYKPENNTKWNGVKVNNRHWIKIK